MFFVTFFLLGTDSSVFNDNLSPVSNNGRTLNVFVFEYGGWKQLTSLAEFGYRLLFQKLWVFWGRPIARSVRIIIAPFGGEGSEYSHYYVKLHRTIIYYTRKQGPMHF